MKVATVIWYVIHFVCKKLKILCVTGSRGQFSLTHHPKLSLFLSEIKNSTLLDYFKCSLHKQVFVLKTIAYNWIFHYIAIEFKGWTSKGGSAERIKYFGCPSATFQGCLVGSFPGPAVGCYMFHVGILLYHVFDCQRVFTDCVFCHQRAGQKDYWCHLPEFVRCSDRHTIRTSNSSSFRSLACGRTLILGRR